MGPDGHHGMGDRVVARSARLELRRFHPDEAGDFHALNCDPEVVRHTGDAAFPSVDAARRFLEQYDHYRLHGFGRWSLYLRATGEYLGFCGLKRRAGDGEVDLGFRLARRHWGCGYATEAGALSLDVGFVDYGLPAVVGRAREDNPASLAVLRKLGMTRQREFLEDGFRWVQYVVTRDRHAAGRTGAGKDGRDAS